jgi:hypothetical protein
VTPEDGLPGPQNHIRWLSGDKKIQESDFGWTKSSQKSLSRWKWFYAPLVRLYYLKNFKKLSGLPVFYSGLNECSLAPQFKWLDSTFKCPLLPVWSWKENNKKLFTLTFETAPYCTGVHL